MIEHPLLPNNRSPFWQSADGQVESGLIHNAHPFYYALLGNRPIQLSDIQALIGWMRQLSQPYPLLLLSQCPGFALSREDETNGLVFYAGQYRALQEEQKQQGRHILSLIQRIAVGGTYLMHGLSAHIRIATPDTQFHDTIPQYPPVPLQRVLEKGLINAIIPSEQLPHWLEQHLSLTEP